MIEEYTKEMAREVMRFVKTVVNITNNQVT